MKRFEQCVRTGTSHPHEAGAGRLGLLMAGVVLSWALAQAQPPPAAPFTKITTGPIVNQPGSSDAAAWGDYDNDGNLDLFVSNFGGANNWLFHNNGDGTFTQITTGSIVNDGGNSHGGAWGDYDNDGFLDLFVPNRYGENNFLYHNNGDGTFTKVTSGPVVNDGGDSLCSAWSDYDCDGFLDLFVGNQGVNFLYHNNGDGTFTKVTSGPIVAEDGSWDGASWGDYDNDGWPDLFLSSGSNLRNALFHNNGDGTFSRITTGSIVNDPAYSVGCAWGDYDNDGYLDMFVANRLGNNFLYHNNGDGSFTKITAGAIVNDGGDSNGCAWGDFDNDGFLDLFVANFPGSYNFLYRNNGDGTFTKITDGLAVNEGGNFHGCALADYDNDGFLDLFVANLGGYDSLYKGDRNSNNWLEVKCVGLVSNRAAIGARVKVKATIGGATRWQQRSITGDGSWCGQHLVAHFGLGDCSQAELVRVEWPSGGVLEMHGVPANQLLTATEVPPVLAIRPPSGDFGHSIQVTMLSSVANGVIRFTLDGSDPVGESPAYTAPFKLSQTATVKARAFVDGNPASDVIARTYTITLTPPTIVTQPANNTVSEGGSVTFSVTAAGSPPLSYQWTFNGSDIGGETNSTLSLSAVTAAQAGAYAVKVSNDASSVTSDAANLTVTPAAPFTKITTGSIVSDGGNSCGGAWGDYDNDGYLDLFVANLDHQNDFLYHNKGDGTFEKVATGPVVTDAASSATGAWADYDNDGNLDLFVANFWEENNCLYRNNGDGTFTKVATGSIVTDGGLSMCCAWADFDNDGNLDLFVANGSELQNQNNFLYRNNGDGTFTKVTTGGIVNDGGFSGGCAWADYDNDGYPDLFVCNMYSPAAFLYHNNRDGTFTRVTAGEIATDTGDFCGCAWGDYDNDGFLDLFFVAGGHSNYLYHNNGDGTFSRVTTGSIVNEVGNWIGCAWADYDNDGYLDLFVANRTAASRLYHNNGDGTFTKVTSGAIVEDVNASNGCAWGDYDNDGFLDLFVANWDGQKNCLYHNNGNGNNWLKVKCVGVVSNRSGIGAKVRVKAVVGGKELWQVREISGGDSWGSQSLMAHFGLGVAATVQTVRVEWPSGQVQELANVTVNQLLVVTEVPPLLMLRPLGGNFDHSIGVTMLTSVTNGVVRYTLDGSEPTIESLAYAGPIKLSQTTTVKARVFVDGNPASDVVAGTYTITLTPPTIVTQPTNKTVTEGGSVTFSVTVTGSPPLAYQWTFNGGDVPDATNSTLSLSAVTAAQAGAYAVKVSNEVGSVTSNAATLTVNPKPAAPAITKQPEALTVPVSGTATFTVEATGTAPLSYQWRRNGVSVSGATTSTLTIPNVQSSHAGTYTVRVSNLYGWATSQGAVLTVIDKPVPPTITAAPEHQVVNAGTDVTLNVTATGTAPLTYQWRFNGALIPNVNGSALPLNNVQSANAGTYVVTVSNSAGSASTLGAVLDVYAGETGGTVNFNNHVPLANIDAPVLDADGVTKLEGPAYLAQLYAGPSAESLAPVGPAVPFLTGSFAGYVSLGAGSARIVPTVTTGQVACVEVRAWDCAKGATYEQALAAGGKIGHSEVLTITTGGAGTPPGFPADLVGLASFAIGRETIPPVITISSPVAGATPDERVVLAGTVTDNAGVASARWERDGQAIGSLALEKGRFLVPDLRLHRGENLFRVVATDVAGNEAAAEVVVTWEPSRTLAVRNAAEQQEGRLMTMALELASEGDVAGLSFVLQYSPEYLAQPELTWSALVSSALSQVNYDTPGEILATLSLPASTIPAGSQVLGQVSFRARSVPSAMETQVEPVVLDVADALGNKVTFGTDTAAGTARILPRQIVGDNNGNNRLDIGDATLIQRLIARFDVPRAWDVPANDLNQSLDLDSGDVIKVLRVVVGLDPQPEVPGGAGQLGFSAGGGGHTSLHAQVTQPQPEGAVESAILVADRLRASPGKFVTVQVWLKNLATSISAASFTLDYPADALRLLNQQAHQLGPAIAADSVLWNVAPGYDAQTGRCSVAAISANPWELTSGVLAEFTFQVQGGLAGQGRWPLQLSAVEVAGKNGYDVRRLPTAALSLNPPPPRLPGQLQLSGDTRQLSVEGQIGLAYIVEASSDLLGWKPIKTLLNANGVLEFDDPEAAAAKVRFYRVKEAP